MGGLLAGFLAIFVVYFVFSIVAQFLIGQLLILAGSLALGLVARNLCLDSKEGSYKSIVIAVGMAGLFGVIYYFALTSRTACDGYYVGKIFGSAGGVNQSGAQISADNYSSLCQWPGFRYACKQYDECNQGIAALRSLPLFLFGLICASVGAAIGFCQALKSPGAVIDDSGKPEENATKIVDKFASEFNLADFARERAEEFEKSTVIRLSVLSGKSERAVKNFLARNNLHCADYPKKKV